MPNIRCTMNVVKLGLHKYSNGDFNGGLAEAQKIQKYSALTSNAFPVLTKDTAIIINGSANKHEATDALVAIDKAHKSKSPAIFVMTDPTFRDELQVSIEKECDFLLHQSLKPIKLYKNQTSIYSFVPEMWMSGVLKKADFLNKNPGFANRFQKVYFGGKLDEQRTAILEEYSKCKLAGKLQIENTKQSNSELPDTRVDRNKFLKRMSSCFYTFVMPRASMEDTKSGLSWVTPRIYEAFHSYTLPFIDSRCAILPSLRPFLEESGLIVTPETFDEKVSSWMMADPCKQLDFVDKFGRAFLKTYSLNKGARIPDRSEGPKNYKEVILNAIDIYNRR